MIIQHIRLNLVAPFAEKDALKALGARWDSAKKTWYIIDVVDFTPFQRWIPNCESVVTEHQTTPKNAPHKLSNEPRAIKTINKVPQHC